MFTLRKSVILATLFIVMMLAVACGTSKSSGGTGSSGGSGGSSAAGEQQGAAPQLEKTKLTISTPTTDINFLPVFVAQAKDFWVEEGLSTNVVTFQGSREQMQAMVSGASDLAASAYTEVIDSYITGNELKSFWGQSNNPGYEWWSAKHITNMDEAKDQKARFAISTPGSLTDVLTRWMIGAAGYDVNDFQIVGGGGLRNVGLL